MRIFIRVSYKNDQVLNNFVEFLKKLELLPTTLKYSSKQNKKKFLTVLKSPHVNKTAQEQFEFRLFNKKFLFESTKPSTIFIILKKLKALSFPGIQLKAKSSMHGVSKRNKNILTTLDPDNVVLNSDSSFVSQKKYLQLFDCYGETCLKNLVYLKYESIQHL